MFCDLVGSTSLAAKLDAEDWRTLVNAYLDEASAAVTGLGGHVLKKLGDGLMALFGYPQAQENDAERAVRAALAIQRALADLNNRNAAKGAPELSARIGIESGSVVMEASGEVFGDASNNAARVQSEAEPGSVLITLNVQRQVAGLFVAEELGARELKGVSQPVQLFRIVRASGGGRRAGARTLTPFVGREEELVLLARRWERARVGEGQLVLVVGEPGLGKSRLVEEFHAGLAETPHTWVEWSASQLLQNTPLHPIVEWGRQRFGLDAPAEQRLADLEDTLRLIGLDPVEHAPLLAPLVDVVLPPGRAANFPPEELRRRQLAAMTAWVLAGARSQPVVLAFEDLHWADPTSLDLLRAFADRGAQAPMLLLATTRPEFRAPWSLRSHHSLISLSPLDRAGVARMVGEISARHALSKELIEGVSERTGGVPLFVEEVTRLLVEHGEQGGIQAIPPTLQQSLAARLDRLGPAREVAQVGAVLGRDFVYALLRDVAEIDEPALQASLERLADADLLFVEGAPPEAKYRFKHALIQDAAYDSLLKSRRQALHAQAAEILRDSASPEPEAVAHHFTQAGLDDLAIEWWGNAGDQALRRSAFQEAISHLGKAIAMADKAAGAASRPDVGDATASRQRVKLQADYSEAVMYYKGFSAEETRAAWAHAAELGANRDDFSERSTVRHGQWTLAIVRGELHAAQELASTFLREAENAGRPVEAGVARRSLGIICYYSGDFLNARIHCERALEECRHGRDLEARERFSDDTGAVAMSVLAITSWQLGEVQRANELINMANHRAVELGHAPSKVHPLYWKSILEILRGDAAAALITAKALEDLCREHGMGEWGTVAEMVVGWAHGRLANPTAGAAEMRQALGVLINKGGRLLVAFFQGLLADLELETLGADSAVARIDEALVGADQATNFASLPFLHRLRGDILLKRTPPDMVPAEDAYRTAIAIAKQQAARSYELLASLALAKLYQSTARPADAYAVLPPALEGFTPTPEMPEIAEAQALLAALAETGEVKSAEASRQRRLQLQTGYSKALMWSQGYGSEEAKAAFARSLELAKGVDKAAERFEAYYGLCVGSLMRGELRSARETAETFLRETEQEERATEAAAARRCLGTACLFQGDLAVAQAHFEQALRIFDSERDREAKFRFGHDTGVAATVYLALAHWLLGEEPARRLIEAAIARAIESAHAPTLAIAYWFKALFDAVRDDAEAGRRAADSLLEVGRGHGLRQYLAQGALFSGWARARLGDPATGMTELRQALAAYADQGNKLFAPFFQGRLAEFEAAGQDAEGPLARIDEALALAQQTEQRWTDAFLHRIRGDILLKADPANPARAEDAYHAALAVAREQGARSFGLQAGLSLAKLCQSTGRPADAHAALAPALEGFSPTSEMPEIAESQALLATLASTDEVKAAKAQREQRLRLQTAYGQAMMWSKGYAAEETKAAFARAAELAGRSGDFSGRLTALHGQWAAALVGGELSSARNLAFALLREMESAGRAWEAGIADRMIGVTAYFHGDFVEARTHCERALEAPDTKPDPNVAQDFSADSIVSSAYLAPTLWVLGHVERARELINTATRRAAELDVPAMADMLHWKVEMEILRDDPVATLSAAESLEVVAQRNDMAQWFHIAQLAAAWARGRITNPPEGPAQVRQALARLVDLGVRTDVGFFSGLLAEFEAETLGATSGLARIDDALRLATQTENRFALSFLHRLRGEILLKRDPSEPTPAEEAFRTALSVAREQGARSFGLRAALSLAKLYQSTGRPAEAQAVLEPALEGFSPTPEMPEIAQAQALLGAIQASAQVRHQ